jgi:hypothetical protein
MMDRNQEQGKGPQEPSSWKARWDKVSRTLGRSDSNRVPRMEQLDNQKRKPVEEFLKSHKDNPIVIGFRGWTIQEYQKRIDFAFELADHVKDRSFSGYTKNPTGKYERPTLRLPDKNAKRLRDTSETNYRGGLSDLEGIKKELEEYITDVELLRSKDFDQLASKDRYELLERLSGSYIYGIEAVRRELGHNDRQCALDSITRCRRYRNSVQKSMEQWERKGKNLEQNPPFYVDGNLRLLRRSTEQLLNALETISRKESLQEQTQLGTLQKQLRAKHIGSF